MKYRVIHITGSAHCRPYAITKVLNAIDRAINVPGIEHAAKGEIHVSTVHNWSDDYMAVSAAYSQCHGTPVRFDDQLAADGFGTLRLDLYAIESDTRTIMSTTLENTESMTVNGVKYTRDDSTAWARPQAEKDAEIKAIRDHYAE